MSAFGLNSAGQIVIRSNLTGKNVTPANDVGIWASDLEGNLNLVVREGQQIDVNNDPAIDDFRTICELEFGSVPSGNEDGRDSVLNDSGQITFGASFTDGSSGIFVSSKVANLFLLRDVKQDSNIRSLAGFEAFMFRERLSEIRTSRRFGTSGLSNEEVWLNAGLV